MGGGVIVVNPTEFPLVIVVGSGGVGKTTLAAAIALADAEQELVLLDCELPPDVQHGLVAQSRVRGTDQDHLLAGLLAAR